MHARATPLPDKSKTFTIQVDNGKVFVFVSAEKITGPSQKKLVRDDKGAVVPRDPRRSRLPRLPFRFLLLREMSLSGTAWSKR